MAIPINEVIFIPLVGKSSLELLIGVFGTAREETLVLLSMNEADRNVEMFPRIFREIHIFTFAIYKVSFTNNGCQMLD
jgi:hypothetical protein